MCPDDLPPGMSQREADATRWYVDRHARADEWDRRADIGLVTGNWHVGWEPTLLPKNVNYGALLEAKRAERAMLRPQNTVEAHASRMDGLYGVMVSQAGRHAHEWAAARVVIEQPPVEDVMGYLASPLDGSFQQQQVHVPVPQVQVVPWGYAELTHGIPAMPVAHHMPLPPPTAPLMSLIPAIPVVPMHPAMPVMNAAMPPLVPIMAPPIPTSIAIPAPITIPVSAAIPTPLRTPIPATSAPGESPLESPTNDTSGVDWQLTAEPELATDTSSLRAVSAELSPLSSSPPSPIKVKSKAPKTKKETAKTTAKERRSSAAARKKAPVSRKKSSCIADVKLAEKKRAKKALTTVSDEAMPAMISTDTALPPAKPWETVKIKKTTFRPPLRVTTTVEPAS
jgi:hypothetical protein